MTDIKIGECNVTVVSIVKGLTSEKEKVSEALKNDYEAVGVALGIEDIEAIRHRTDIKGELEPSDIDSVYSYFLKNYGPIDMPDPSFCLLIDRCSAENIPVIPLDMTDEDYSKVYCDTVSTLDFLKEKHILKKAMKTKWDPSSAEAFAVQWDDVVNEIKGYMKMSQIREKYIADQIRDTARYRKTLLVLIELERAKGIIANLE
jgi:hypothetical protein